MFKSKSTGLALRANKSNVQSIFIASDLVEALNFRIIDNCLY